MNSANPPTGPKPGRTLRHFRCAIGRFSNRPVGVKHFQAIHRFSVNVAHGLVLLFGIGTQGPSIMGSEDEAEQSIGRPCRLMNSGSKRPSELTLVHRPARDIFPPQSGARVSSYRI
jgi:hypothetical protein